MSWRSPAWGALGIAPTRDQNAIRRAYAARLKAIDADRDPAAFIALREAYEQARQEAAWADEDEDWDEDEAETAAFEPVAPAADLVIAGDAGPALLPDPPQPEAGPARSPWAPPRPEDYDAHGQALHQLLDRPEDADPWPSPEEAEAMLAHWRVLSADPRLQQMDRFADVEQWFAGIVAHYSPFTDPLVRPVSDFFGWMASAGDIRQSPAIAFIVQRRRALDFADAVSRPGHPLHAAWVELTTPADDDSRRNRKVRRADVEKLIETVRRDVPEVEGNFDAYRIGMWLKKKDWGIAGGIFWWLLVVGAIQLFRLASCAPETPPAPVVIPATLEHASTDIDRALEMLFADKLDLATVETRNPDLAAALNRQWQADRNAGAALPAHAAAVRRLLDQRYRDGIANASVDLLRERQRYELAEAELVRGLGAKPCAAYLRGDTVQTELPLPPALELQRKALVARMVLETRPTAKPRPARNSFAVPRDVLAASAKRAGMDEDALVRAMRYEGPDEAQCRGRIAFIQTVLALPAKRAEPLLRAM